VRNIRALTRALCFTAAIAAGTACAQTIQFPKTGSIGTAPATIPPATASPYSNPASSYGSGTFSGSTAPANTIPGNAGAGSSIFTPPTASSPPPFTAPVTPITPYSFDPYSTSPGAPNPWNTAPAISGGLNTVPSTGGFAPPASPFSSTPGTFGAPATGSPYISPGAYPSQNSNSVFPNGVWATNPNAQAFDYSQALRLVQDVRLTHTYVGNGSDPTDVNINDTVAAVTFAFPNFLGSGQPIFFSPTFGIHLWDGPHSLPADLPPSAYSAFFDTQYSTDPNQQLGAEFGYRLGVFTDFHTFNSHSLRIMGLGLVKLKITPTTTLKLGAMYINRNDLKLLPAGGILWQPTPQIRFDIFFPQPKLAGYLTSVNNKEVWWYAAGEYGGGAWTIQRTSGVSDRVDINDIRVSVGLESVGPGLNAFGEVGYVFNRQVVYVVTPSDTFNPGNTFMIRMGLSF